MKVIDGQLGRWRRQSDDGTKMSFTDVELQTVETFLLNEPIIVLQTGRGRRKEREFARCGCWAGFSYKFSGRKLKWGWRGSRRRRIFQCFSHQIAEGAHADILGHRA